MREQEEEVAARPGPKAASLEDGAQLSYCFTITGGNYVPLASPTEYNETHPSRRGLFIKRLNWIEYKLYSRFAKGVNWPKEKASSKSYSG